MKQLNGLYSSLKFGVYAKLICDYFLSFEGSFDQGYFEANNI